MSSSTLPFPLCIPLTVKGFKHQVSASNSSTTEGRERAAEKVNDNRFWHKESSSRSQLPRLPSSWHYFKDAKLNWFRAQAVSGPCRNEQRTAGAIESLEAI